MSVQSLPPLVFVTRADDSVSLHNAVDAREILAADPTASIHTGLVSIRKGSENAVTVTAAADALDLFARSAPRPQLVSTLPTEE